jgi:homoserine dehydrogenase
MDEPLGIALIGCGTVGSGVARLLVEQPERLRARAGRRLELRRVLVRNLDKPRSVNLPQRLFTADLRQILDDSGIQVAVELAGGIDWARHTVLDLLGAGKHVVTANKALLSEHGREVFDAARRHGLCVAFEASVAGGVPIIAALAESLTANQILSIKGIVNGTCNYILTQMTEHDLTYDAALAEAQAKGYAESDPTLDVDGTDAAHKLAILAQIAFGVNMRGSQIGRRGIARIDAMDIRFARDLGYTVKLLSEAWLEPTTQLLALHVAPVLLRKLSPLALVRGAYNAIHVQADAVGDTLYYGKGAGQMPTASAVVADLIDIAVGRAQRTFQTLRLWSENGSDTPIRIRPTSEVRTRFYLRSLVSDRPGVLAEIARVLAEHGISISSVMQHEALEEHEGDTVPLVVMTHTARTGSFQDAARIIERLPFVAAPCVYFPVAD